MSIIHSFDVDVAMQHGLTGAVLLQHLQFWILKNRANGKHQHEGRTWTYSSIGAFSDLFPYLSPDQIRRSLDKLVSAGVLVKGNHNQSAYDRTLWYAFSDESIWLPCQHHLADLPNQNGMGARPIPVVITDITTDIKTKAQSAGKTKKDRFDPLKVLLPENLSRESWEAWIAYRRQRKLTCSEICIKQQLIKLGDAGRDAAAIIHQSISNGWQGLFPTKAVPKPYDSRIGKAHFDRKADVLHMQQEIERRGIQPTDEAF